MHLRCLVRFTASLLSTPFRGNTCRKLLPMENAMVQDEAINIPEIQRSRRADIIRMKLKCWVKQKSIEIKRFPPLNVDTGCRMLPFFGNFSELCGQTDRQTQSLKWCRPNLSRLLDSETEIRQTNGAQQDISDPVTSRITST
jgi:hypothetical protein